MKTIAELKKERLTIRTINPLRSMVLGMLIDGASKIAKDEQRDPTQKDIEHVAKRMIKESEKDIELYIETNRMSENDTLKENNTYAIESARDEINILKEFIPIQMDEAAIRKLLSDMPEEILLKKNMGGLMKEMKNIEHMDVGLLAKILNEVLK